MAAGITHSVGMEFFSARHFVAAIDSHDMVVIANGRDFDEIKLTVKAEPETLFMFFEHSYTSVSTLKIT
jgi:hypothetical protein